MPDFIKKSIKYITLLLIFYAVWIIVIPFLIKVNIPTVQAILSKNYGISVSIEQPEIKLGVIPKINILCKKLDITNDNLIINFENFDLELRIIPLISGRVHINHFYADDFIADITVKESALFNDIGSNNKIKIKSDRLNIKKYSIIIKDNEHSINSKIIGNDFIYEQNKASKIFKTTGEIEANNETACLNADMVIRPSYSRKKSEVYLTFGNINLELLSQLFPLDENFKDLKGIIDLSILDSKIFVNIKDFKAKDKFNNILQAPDIVVRSEYNLDNKDITINNLQLLAKDLHVRVDGVIKNYLKKHKKADISLKVIDTNSLLITNLLPNIDVPDFSTSKLKFYGLRGIINADVKIKGNLNNPKCFGNIDITDCVLPNKTIKNNPKATIKLTLKDKKLYSDTFVPIDKQTFVKVDGISNINGSRVYDFKIKASNYIDYDLFHKIIVPLHEIFDFEIGILPCVDATGQLKFELTTNKVKDKLTAKGSAEFRNIKTRIDHIKNLEIKTSKGLLDFEGPKVKMTIENPTINGIPAEVSGYTTIDSFYDVVVTANNLKTQDLYNSLKDVIVPENLKKDVDSLKIYGNTDIDVNLKGQLRKDEKIVLNENLFVIGKALIRNNIFSIKGYAAKNVNTDIKCDKNYILVNSDFKLNNSPAKLFAEIKNDKINASVDSKNVDLKYFLPEQYSKNVRRISAAIAADYKGSMDEFDINKLNADLSLFPFVSSDNYLKINSARIKLQKGILKLYDVNAIYKNKPLKTDLIIKNVSEENCIVDGNFKAENVDTSIIDTLSLKKYVSYLEDLDFERGLFDINGTVKNNNLNIKMNFKDIVMKYIPLNMPVKIINGQTTIYNDKIIVNKFNTLIDDMPLLVNGTLYNYKIKPMFDFSLNAIPKQTFIDKYINKNNVYPIKIKGDILSYLQIKGFPEHFNIKSKINFMENSSLYYIGAIFGDPNHKIDLTSNIDIIDYTNLKIKDLKFSKFIYSQDNKLNELPMIKINGGVNLYKNYLDFNNLYVKTINPTDAKIFNVIFKKPIIKQGQFLSNLKINGKSYNPHIVGDFSLSGVDIPFFNTTIRDISCEFKDSVINLKSNGEALDNKYILSAQLQNDFTPPYKINNAELFTEILNIDDASKRLKQIDIEQTQNHQNMFSGNSSGNLNEILIIDKLKIIANKIKLRSIDAENFEALLSLKNKNLSIDKFSLNTAKGRIDGSYSYGFKDKRANLDLSVYSVKANTISETLFDLHDQIYGDLTGTTKLSCIGDTYKTCMETLSGKGEFIVNDGKMPKLGSMEYLLKAGNLVKSGITGLSINGIIDLIAPLKTGEFKNINGLFVIKDGIAHTVKVFSNGKDLNLYITGNYNFKNSVADMKVFGKLSKNVTTVWGNIGNLSLNTLLNTIPKINMNSDELKPYELSKVSQFSTIDKNARKFVVEILGDINGKNYVKSFRWIN